MAEVEENAGLSSENSEENAENLDEIARIDKELDNLLDKFGATFNKKKNCRPFLLTDDPISVDTVDNAFDELQKIPAACSKAGQLIVIVDSGGGDIHAAYNLAMLFRKHGKEELIFVVPRWAKSAATLLVCGGDSVIMTPVAELGPLDPQITTINTMEQRLEKFSPLHIESTLEMIRSEFQQGNTQLAEGLLQRLQFPITLGSFKKTLEICRQYSIKLLASRMHRGEEGLAEEIADKLVQKYADHGFCINIDEAKDLGLVVKSPSKQQLEHIWQIHKLVRRKAELLREQEEKELQERLSKLPPGLQTEASSPDYHKR